MIPSMTRTMRAAVIVALSSLSMSLTFKDAAGSDSEGNGWYYCFNNGCPNMEAFCAPRGGLEPGAYCAHDPCWGSTTNQWYDWIVEC
jgi:hypothetical protein